MNGSAYTQIWKSTRCRRSGTNAGVTAERMCALVSEMEVLISHLD